MISEAKVLLVDDSPTDAKLLQIAAKKMRWIKEVRVACDGLKGLEILRAEESPKWLPHLIFLDLNMPRMDGFEFLEKIKADENLCHIPILVLTTSSAPKDMLASYQRQANCFLTKPPDFPSFSNMLKSVEEFWLRVATIPSES